VPDTELGRRPFLKRVAAAAAALAVSRLGPDDAGVASQAASGSPAFWAWAARPPMGWNSWDSFGAGVTEAQTRAQADYMAAHLKRHGWSYIVVDIQWYEPGAEGHDYRKDAVLSMDGYGRLMPAANRFPSAAGGAGFAPLAEHVHALGLKFGVHLMRGIPRQAVERNLPVKDTDYRAGDIADRSSICPWNPDMFGVDMERPGAQAYYDSVFALLASWGVDYVKVDDISRPYHEHEKEIEAVRRAIDRAGRPIVLSLSPGETALDAAAHVRQHANLWRISDDFWDRWLALREQFGRLAAWNPHRAAGAWPDADMLPLGVIMQGRRATRFTADEQRTLMTLWSIARSPLMHGGDMTKMDPATLALLTNDEVVAVNQDSTGNRPLFERDDLMAWVADRPGTRDKYLAVFNARDRVRLTAGNARHASPVVEPDPAAAVDIDVDLSGASRLFLVAEPGGGSARQGRAFWRSPRLLFADGTERPLTDWAWTRADSLWDSAVVRKDAAGRAAGIAAQTKAVIEYAVPAGATRFKASGTAERQPGGQRAGSIRLLVVVATSENENTAPGVPIAVRLPELGFTRGARVRDLWTHQDLGIATAEFEPVIPFHGAGLYRLTPAR
jgi:hypothetical protein